MTTPHDVTILAHVAMVRTRSDELTEARQKATAARAALDDAMAARHAAEEALATAHGALWRLILPDLG